MQFFFELNNLYNKSYVDCLKNGMILNIFCHFTLKYVLRSNV